MKISQSLLTSTTKMSLLQPAKSHQSNLQHFIIVFTYNQQQIHRVQITVRDKTIKQIIVEALQKFNLQFNLNLELNPQKYAAYAARKNGKKISDYPSVQLLQNVAKTNIRYFFITKQQADKNKNTTITNRIKTQFQPSQNMQLKVKQNRSCFCLFW